MKDEYLSKERFCNEFHVGKRTALWLISSGLLPAIDTGRKTDRYLISRKDISCYLRKRELDPKKYRYRGRQAVASPLPDIVEKQRRTLLKVWADVPDVLRLHDVESLLGYDGRVIARWRRELGLGTLKVSHTIYYPKKSLVDFLLSTPAQAQYPKSEKHTQLMGRIQNV